MCHLRGNDIPDQVITSQSGSAHSAILRGNSIYDLIFDNNLILHQSVQMLVYLCGIKQAHPRVPAPQELA
ncbi:hypothetical protein E4T56_gene833 [Termitomyces sp. T112]|nr:hypothetical protein E4T56_gene833 [Termitomyces sp. T112]